MKFAFIVNNYPPRVGGVEMHVASLARHLTDAGHSVIVYTLHETQGRSVEGGVTVVRLPEYLRVQGILGFPALGTARRVARALRAEAVDVVSVHTRFFPMSWVGLRAGRRAGVPVVHTEHGSGYVVSDSALVRLASRMVDHTVGRAVLRGADTVLGVSENVVSFVARLSGRRARVFYNAIEGSDSETQVTQRPEHLVFVGRMVPGKGWDVFVDCVARLRADGLQITAEMLGDGPDMSALRAHIEALGLADAIAVRGRVDSQAVRESLRGATLVNPTTLAEGFQTTLLEALAEQGRVVTYPVPGAQALAAEGRSVTITADRTESALLDALRAVLSGSASSDESDAMDAPLDSWTWATRSREYVEICERSIGSTRAK